ncbi:MAG: NAD(P)/FAD-dependent oxidoreductase, partial [Dongiaceae bacterium]
SLHPGLYHLGLLDRATAAGAQIFGRTRVTGVARDGADLTVATERGRIAARDVLVATNGYTGPATPWLHRRIIPFNGFMIATERLSPEVVARVLPNARTLLDHAHNIRFMRRAPDGSRILFGGLTGPAEPDLPRKAARLQALLARIVPDLAGVRLSHVWTGKCGATTDLYPHIGVRDGIHFALGYCFAGVPMGTWLGHKSALRIQGAADAATAFDDLPFRPQPLPWANPLLVRLFMAHYDRKDRRSDQ